jgi:hypothetical protein
MREMSFGARMKIAAQEFCELQRARRSGRGDAAQRTITAKNWQIAFV